MTVPRGGNSTKSYTTTNLVNHLSTKDLEVNVKYIERKANNEAQPPRETWKRSIEHHLLLKVPWDINDNKSQRVHKRIGEMLAVDCQSLSMVEDIGLTRVLQVLELRYKCLIRKYLIFTDRSR